MDDLGGPISYMTVEHGVPVYSSDGAEVGTVEHVLADADADVFDGIIIDTRSGPGGWRFVDAPEVADLHERGVRLKLDRAAAERLPEPHPNPAELRVDPADADESVVMEKLRRAWDYISGRY
jgi:hypothetical protein